MPWTKGDYPDSFKNLPEATRNKAIEIANALLRDGKSDGDAIPIAISKAKMQAQNNGNKTAMEYSNGLVKIAYDYAAQSKR